MSNTTPADMANMLSRRGVIGLAGFAAAGAAVAQTTPPASTAHAAHAAMSHTTTPLTPPQLAIGPVAATTSSGDLPRLNTALGQALDAGHSVAALKEVLVQLYAYAGFPRSLNALAEFMKVLEARRQRGVHDSEGRLPGPVPTGDALLAAGTANQTKLSGAPVTGPLFTFAPAIDQFLKTHLFGDIFARDNLDWQSRELATVAALGALEGVESQLIAHIRISLNVGLTASQLRQFADALADAGLASGERVRTALAKQQAAAQKG